MQPKVRFVLHFAWLGVLSVALLGFAGLVLWVDLSPTERHTLRSILAERAALLVFLAGLLGAVLAGLLRQWLVAYPQNAQRITEEIGIIHRVNAEHRLKPSGPVEMRKLGEALNEFAEVYDQQQREVEARIEETNGRLEQEKNRLATLMSELAQSVLVCNNEGRILLYNPRATQLLAGDASAPGGMPVGLGRSIFAVLDKSLITHALEQIRHRLDQQAAKPVAHFVAARAGHLLRAQMAPVLDQQCESIGFVLILEDITRTVEINSRRDLLLQQLTEGSRSALANIRAAVETLEQYPDMDSERRERFTEVIRDEAERLTQRLEQSLSRHADLLGSPWPLEDMLASDLAAALQRNFAAALGLRMRCEVGEQPLWLSVDSYSLVQVLTQVMGALASACRTREIGLELSAEGRCVRLSLSWGGQPLDPNLLHEWEELPLNLGGEGENGATLKSVVARHGGEVWCQLDRAAGVNRLCLQLPRIQPEALPEPLEPSQGRPVYYDFDLFNQPGQTAELDERPLSELSYTVFDTETTGLSPSDGDEIISIGAVRVVNGRLLRQECFDRLIKPSRPISKASQEVHGLTPQMLVDQPPIEQVLPQFHRFAEDTVLVAHNAAFDMRFLQLKEAQTGVTFIQPVLDTLLLSALAHPGHLDDEHRLERIATRLGVEVIGRHTALGDAIVTAEVLLKLIPLLAERGIHNLRQAREASRKTLYARVKY